MPAWAWLVVFGLCIAATLPVIRTSSVTESGTELLALEAERERLRSEIRSLAAHVGELGSLERIKQQAEERLNMVVVRPTVALTVDQPPPARTLPVRLLPTGDAPSNSANRVSTETTSTIDDPIWRAFIDALVFE